MSALLCEGAVKIGQGRDKPLWLWQKRETAAPEDRREPVLTGFVDDDAMQMPRQSPDLGLMAQMVAYQLPDGAQRQITRQPG